MNKKNGVFSEISPTFDFAAILIEKSIIFNRFYIEISIILRYIYVEKSIIFG